MEEDVKILERELREKYVCKFHASQMAHHLPFTMGVTSSTDSQIHNNIMAAGSRDRPPMLAAGRYPQRLQAVKATDDFPAIPEHTTVETPMDRSPENKAYFLAEKEAIHLILTGIGDKFYSTVDACQTAQEMWEAIKGYNKQCQNEVNELRAERLARNANPLALVATTQADQDLYYQTSRSHKSYAPSSKPLIPTISHTSTRHKGKEIAKPITPPSETASEEDSDPKQAQRDKDMQNNLSLIAKYFKKIYKPTYNNLRTSLNSRNKNVDTTPRLGFSALTAGNLDILPRNVESKKGLRTSHMDEEVDEQELEAHYSYMAKIQEVPTADSGTDSEPVEQNDQNDVESDDEHVALANLIANLKLDTKQTEFEKYKAFNDRTVDYDKLERKLNEALGQLAQKDTFLRYIDTRPNGEALRKCILSGPYKPTTILVQVVEATDDSPTVPEHTTVETPMSMSPENKAHFEAEKEAIHLILPGIVDEIYSTVDACQTAREMWEAIERFVMIVKQHHKLDKVSYHKLFDILKQHQNEVNELCAEKLARNANPLALVATAQASQDPYSQTTSDPEQAQREKDMQKNLALIAKYFKKIYKPTNNNLRTSLNSKNKNVDTTPWFKNDSQSRQFRNQRKVNVDVARENVGSQVVKQSGIQCFNCREFGHFAKECRKLKRLKDSAYHKERMLLCKQAEKGVPIQAEQYDWLEDTDEEVDEQELEAYYSYMTKIQEVPTADSRTNSEPVE
nr:hypothetical protein [Tanacetum cinerariifolium]